MEIHDILKLLNACKEAQEWASDKTWEQIYNECHRGDWLCWLFARTNINDIQLLTLVKGHQANTVRHLMKDKRILAAVDAAIAFGEGKISIEELNRVANDSYDVPCTKYADVAAAAAATTTYSFFYDFTICFTPRLYTHYNADNTTAAAFYSAEAAFYINGRADSIKNKQDTADIFRQFISIDKFNLC